MSTSGIQPTAQKQHLPHLDGLRACLALYIVFDHACLTIWPAARVVGNAGLNGGFTVELQNFLLGGATQGRAAVDWFIVLSGFCLMLPTLGRGYCLRHGTIDFYWRRARRILPTYWIALALSVALCFTLVSKKTGTHWDVALPVTWGAVASAVFLTNDIIDAARINHVFWSIAVEWRIYFLFPLILWLWRRWGGARATLAVAGVAIFTSFMLPHISESLFFLETTLSFIGLFAIGGYAAYLSCGVEHKNVAKTRRLLQVTAFIAAVWAIASAAQLMPKRAHRDPIVDAAFGVTAASCLALWSMPGPSFMRSTLSWFPLRWIGVFAFSLYLVHAPIVQWCWQLFVQPRHMDGCGAFAVLVLVSMPSAVAFAWLFSLAFERPFLSSQQRRAIPPVLQPSNIEARSDELAVSSA